MFFRQILHEEHACASYLVGCQTRNVCVVVDPQGDVQSYIDQVQGHGMRVSGVIETHIHADHVSSARTLATRTGANLYIGAGADVTYAYQPLADGQVLDVGNRHIRVIHTPGHTPEHVCLLVDDWFLLTGDTLFVGDVGRVDLALHGALPDELHARAAQLYQSLQRLLAFPNWTEVYPGHYAGSVCGRGMDGKPMTTLGRERLKNPLLQLGPAAFVEAQTRELPPLPFDFHHIKRHNAGLE